MLLKICFLNLYFSYQMQDRARMQQDTCILSKQLLDRYGSVAEITEENWQLVTIIALFVASKYEEVWPPHVVSGHRKMTLEGIDSYF